MHLHANWTAADLVEDQSWINALDDGARTDLEREVKRLFVPGKPVFDYDAGDVDLGRASAPIATSFQTALNGPGIALIKRLPRETLSEDEFGFLTWMIGLTQGVPRPQGKDSKYLHAVRNVGTNYRSPTGRGYSSNSELDFHIDGADLVALTCYNGAREGGLSMAVSNEAINAALKAEYPQLLPLLFEAYPFSLQGEQAPGMPAWVKVPVFSEANGHVFIRWVRNRVESSQTIEDAPRIDARHWEALDMLDAVIRRPEHVATMMLEPGDMQILNNHRCLHSRTEFSDFDEPERKRLLFRLWLSPPQAEALPPAIAASFGSADGNTVRGGIPGQHYDERCREFDALIAAFHGMRMNAKLAA